MGYSIEMLHDLWPNGFTKWRPPSDSITHRYMYAEAMIEVPPIEVRIPNSFFGTKSRISPHGLPETIPHETISGCGIYFLIRLTHFSCCHFETLDHCRVCIMKSKWDVGIYPVLSYGVGEYTRFHLTVPKRFFKTVPRSVVITNSVFQEAYGKKYPRGIYATKS